MGRRSVKSNKNRYHVSRENAELTRDAASEQLFISPDRIEKIETQGALPHPDEVLSMAKIYKDPTLPNHYCSHECPIGRAYVPALQLRDVAQITLEILADLNKMTRYKERLIEITVDGVVHEDETKDFRNILGTLNHMSTAIDSLKLWVEHEVAFGKLEQSDVDPDKDPQ